MDPLNNSRKKITGYARIPDSTEFIELSEIDLSNPEELLKYKPTTYQFSDQDWILSAAICGIVHAWNHDFKEWLKREILADRISPSAKVRDYFGEAGIQGWKTTNGDWEEFTAFLLETDWSLEKLGKFGEWFKLSKVPPKYAKAIIKEFLED